MAFVSNVEFSEDWSPVTDVTDDSLAHCLGKLDALSRYAICLSYLYGFTHEELSRTSGAPLGTLKSRIRRGVIALRECLKS